MSIMMMQEQLHVYWYIKCTTTLCTVEESESSDIHESQGGNGTKVTVQVEPVNKAAEQHAQLQVGGGELNPFSLNPLQSHNIIPVIIYSPNPLLQGKVTFNHKLLKTTGFDTKLVMHVYH